jgi:hypothetical protein
MSEFELIFLFNEFFNTAFARLNDFMVGLFAMLAAGYFVAAKLSRTMAWLITGLYTVFSMATIVPAIAATDRMVLASQQVRLAASHSGSELATLISIMPTREFVIPVMIILMVIAYAGAMVFFFQARKNVDALA